ncbi:MAG: cation:proton antiporter subunit C [Pseudochelatococcus sp.]|jgi:multisubunit Na+/H+ antiporter MnhC subunit|uniref:cation:proton antiporter subunit C n=1 Tax=Pseudochelatococcus sp. TaxID=2020869 RepID=UPI003D9033A1
MSPPVSQLALTTGLALALIGLWGLLSHRHILRMIIGFSLLGTGIRLALVATGYVTGATAPILDEALGPGEAAVDAVDALPSALAITAAVLGFSVTAVMLAFAIRLYRARGTLSIDAFTESKW